MNLGFWEFSLRFYEPREVQHACLELQDDHGADVNVALYLLWRAGQGERFDAEGVAAIDASVAPWREQAVQPLRAVRRSLKETPLLEADVQESFRNKIKKVELDAEKLEQVTLEQLPTPAAGTGTGKKGDCARKSLCAYAEFLQGDMPEELIETFVARLDALV